ncbi:MAG: hypothetical protein JSS72_11785 [Armatimonadetes bacterium]|nr:hypothetical protein [Armatimonadota bacterium]
MLTNQVAGQAVAKAAVMTGDNAVENWKISVLESIVEREPIADQAAKLFKGLKAAHPTLHPVLYTFDPTDKFLHLAAASDLTADLAEAIQKHAIGPKSMPSGVAASRREKVEVQDLSINPLTTAHRALFEAAGLRSAISIPIMESNEVLGALEIYFEELNLGGGAANSEIQQARELAAHILSHHQYLQGLKALERTVRDQETEIRGLHVEIDAGKNSLAHDVRAPLKVLLNQIGQMQEMAVLMNDHNAHDGLDKMRITALRMDHLINDLINIANLSREDLILEDCDFSAVATRVGKLVVDRMHRNDTRVLVQPDIKIHADPRLLELILESLISNAVRFSLKASDPQVEIGANVTGEKVTYFVRDNGPGFHPHQATRIFEPFERVHAEREYPGSGLALATIKRLAERHGGRAWAMSAIGKGSTFAFTVA